MDKITKKYSIMVRINTINIYNPPYKYIVTNFNKNMSISRKLYFIKYNGINSNKGDEYMKEFRLTLPNNKDIYVSEECTLYDVIKKYNLKGFIPITLAKIDDEYYELNSKINKSGIFKIIDIREDIGLRTYIRTLRFILVKSTLDLYKDAKIIMEHSFGKGLFGEIHKSSQLTKQDIIKIKNKMLEIIEKDLKIEKIYMEKSKAIKIFENYGMIDKVRLLKQMPFKKVKLYKLGERYDYFYGAMAYSTGVINKFDLIYYDSGFILRYPTEKDIFNIPKFINYPKLFKIFRETEKWGDILDVPDVGALNDKVDNNEIIDIVRVSEALHEKKIANIADKIKEKEKVKVVLISGPTSSGKTTFSKRLGIQLRVNGLIPFSISLDNYFVNREYTPKDEKGNYDFESINALDLQLFNNNLKDMLEGKEVELPTFNFKTGKREWKDKKVKLPERGILIIEGIHGLNPILTKDISNDNKFKVYISALTQLNLDNHNTISTTDVRIIRRIVRDYLFRGYAVEETLKMWPSIKKGEEKNIFVFQENADIMFNSTLVYELCVLKKYALSELNKVDKSSTVYYEAIRLKSFLNFFKEIDKNLTPENSILREFIGESCFH